MNYREENLGEITNPNATVTNGVVHESSNASAFTLPIKYQASWWNPGSPTGHCYTPLVALPGYHTRNTSAFDQRTDLALPTAQALAKLQLESNDARLADQQKTAISALQNSAQLVAPAVTLATVLLTATTCLGTLASIKILELYTDLWVFVVVTKAGWFKGMLVVVACTTTVATFAAAPVAAMMWQDHTSRHTDLSYTYGNFIHYVVPATQVNTLSIISATVTYRQDPPLQRLVVCASALLLTLTVAWWFYATARILIKMHVRYMKETEELQPLSELSITQHADQASASQQR